MKLRFASAALFAFPAPLFAAQPAQSFPVAGMLKMFFVLLVVLAMLFAVAWFLKRIAVSQKIPGGSIKVIAGAAVGQRERVVLVEVGETWLVVGVAPGHVSALHTMPKIEISEESEPPQIPEKKFSSWLKQVVERRNAGS
ncbi:MAG TPA: flagellar biosynthetic protein FliO [Burkholderiales bacterium]|nr:flagellar biosynthetic protein FliO [Burkholderiales bacterium]